MALSQRRAKIRYGLLVANKVPADRLTSEVEGETQPREIENDNDYPPFKRVMFSARSLLTNSVAKS